MDIFGIGILEVMLVLLLVAVVFGPHKLPEIAGQFGRAVRELREYARDFRDEYLTDFEEMKEEYLEVRQDLEETDAGIRADARELDTELRRTAREIEAEATVAVQDAELAAQGKTPAASPPAPGGSGNASTAERAAGSRAVGGRRPRSPASRPARSTVRPANVISINRRRRLS